MRASLVASILVASLFAGGCSTPDTPPPPPQTIEQLDVSRKVTVEARLKGDGELAGEQIRVTAKGGTVVLEGTVQTADEKERAEKLAKSVQGVDKVENKLELRPR